MNKYCPECSNEMVACCCMSEEKKDLLDIQEGRKDIAENGVITWNEMCKEAGWPVDEEQENLKG